MENLQVILKRTALEEDNISKDFSPNRQQDKGSYIVDKSILKKGAQTKYFQIIPGQQSWSEVPASSLWELVVSFGAGYQGGDRLINGIQTLAIL